MSRALIRLQNVSFAYPNSRLALESASITINEGEFVGIIGPNGGGKSTLLKLFLGILQPTAGTIEVFETSPRDARSRVGYVPQHSTFMQQFPINVLDTVALGRLGMGSWLGSITRDERKSAQEYLAKLGVEGLSKYPISSLSGGQLQRVLIARALVARPQILLLDEPTASVDPHGEEDIFKVLTQVGERLTIAVVSHDVGFVSSYVNKIVCVSRRVVTHKPSEISAQTLSQLYGGHIHAVVHDHQHDLGHH